MIPATAPEQAVLASRTYKIYLRVEIQDATDAWLDYSDYVNQDFQYLAEVGIDVDARIAQARIELVRESSGNSLAPLLNSDIDVGRGVRIAVARVAAGATPVAGDYKPIFAGSIDEWGHPSVDGEQDDNRLSLVARDGLADLQDRWVEEETEYGTDAGTPLEDVMQAILDDWADGVSLYVPTATGTDAGRYRQEKTSVLDALQALADLIGWVIEYRWDSVSGAWRPTLYEPDRTPAATQWTFGPDDYFAVTQLHVARYNIRNVVTVRYTDAATGERTYYTASDVTSIGKYGRRWMEIEEADDSPINTAALAQAMADAALSDLSEPTADQEIVAPLFWRIQLGDYLGFLANFVHYDTDQEFGVVGYTHIIENGTGETRIRTRGKPAGSVRGWLRREHKPRPPVDTVAGRAIQDFREISRTPTEVVYSWRLGADLVESWIHDYQEQQPYSDDKWPGLNRMPEEITDDREVTYAIAIPEQGFVGYFQVEGRLLDGSIGDMERVLFFPTNVAGDHIAFARAKVNQVDGSVELAGWATDRTGSVAFAYNVGDADDPAPSVTAATLQGTGADGGGLITGFTSDFETTLPAGTVDYGQTIKVMLVGYINANGTGPDGTAADHGDPVGAQDERFKITTSDQIANGVVIAEKLTESSRNFNFPAEAFSAPDWDTVAWAAGTLTLSDGSTYAISAGNTGDMGTTAVRYIYFDPDVSATVLQVSTNEADASGERKLLLAVAKRAPFSDQRAFFVPAVGVFGINETNIGPNSISTGHIQALTITAANIAAGAITAAKINVASLSAISADLGTVTAGTVSTNVLIASDTFTATAATFNGTVQIDLGLLVLGDFQHDGDLVGFFAGGPSPKITVTGSRGGNAALASLLSALASYGLIVDGSS